MRGFTLVELLVVLVLLGVVAGVSTVAVASLRRPSVSSVDARLREARVHAIRTGRPTRLVDDSGRAALFLPDGRAIGAGLDPLTGAPRHATP